jgi:hypothetical protein
MAKKGTLAVLKIGSAAAPTTTTDIAPQLSSIDGLGVSSSDISLDLFGIDWATSMKGQRSADDLSISGPYSAALHELLSGIDAMVDDETVLVEFGPAGNTTGLLKRSAHVFLTSLNVKTSTKDVVLIEATFKVTGAVTDSAW